MKKFNNSLVIVTLAAIFAFSLVGQVKAATTPSLGTADTFAILANVYTNTVPGTTISGDLGYTTGPAVSPTVNGTTYVADSTYNQAGISQGSALANLNSQPCSFTFAPGAIDLATDATHGPAGIYTPGVYCISGAASIGAGGITLSGGGTYIFRMDGALNTVANSTVTLSGGASACDVFWTPTAATTLGANSTFVGTDIDASGITIGSNVTWTGRALAFGGTVSTDVDTISVPDCSSFTPTTTPTPTTTASSGGGSTVAAGGLGAGVSSSSSSDDIVPGLPSAGIGPEDNSQKILPVGVFVVLFSLYFARKRWSIWSMF